MHRIILDTDFLVNCADFGIDFATELRRICDFQFEIAVLDKTLDELDAVIEKKKKAAAAKLAKTMIEKLGVTIIATAQDKHVDELILDMADSTTVVCTQDLELRKKLKDCGIKVVVVRQKKYLAMQQ